MTPLWPDEAYERLGQLAPPELVADARDWLHDGPWAGRPAVDLWAYTVPASAIMKGLHRHYVGGVEGFAAAWAMTAEVGV